MKLIAEYLEHEKQFEQLAASEKRLSVKTKLLKQAVAYRQLAVQRARYLGLPEPGSLLLEA